MTTQNFGLIRQGAGNAVLKNRAIPKLRNDYILVRVVAIALNPTDWTTLDAPGDDGTLVGCDYAGIVEEVGNSVTKNFKKGDRVAGFAHGANDANPEDGAFAQVITVKGDMQMHIPDDVSFEAAATVAVGVASSGYALYNILGLPWPSSRPQESGVHILIYGGSSASGSIAIQLARLSGMTVSTTCSPKHFELLKRRGAHHVYDYRDPNVGQRIRDGTDGKLKTVFDTIATEETAAICAEAIGPEGGNSCTLLPVESPRSDVKSKFFLGYSMSGESYIFEGETYPAQPEDYTFAVKFLSVAERLWAEGRWEPHPQRIEPGGVLGAIEGMQRMREGRGPSGEKLVYRIADTEWPAA